MSIKYINAEELCRMNWQEGLVLQGCGGDSQEWLDGINELLTDDGILLNGTKLENALVFTHGKFTNICFPFDGNAKINVGKFEVWRLKFREQFLGTWLSDYVENRLGGFVTEETDADEDENISMGGI